MSLFIVSIILLVLATNTSQSYDKQALSELKFFVALTCGGVSSIVALFAGMVIGTQLKNCKCLKLNRVRECEGESPKSGEIDSTGGNTLPVVYEEISLQTDHESPNVYEFTDNVAYAHQASSR